MDLVEIRKKANSKKVKPAKKKKPAAEEIVAPREQVTFDEAPDSVLHNEESTPVKPAPVSSAAKQESVGAEVVSTVAAVEIDPLDELFSFHDTAGLATEANYLQAMNSEDADGDKEIQQWLTFSLADEEYALTIESVSEIIKPREVTDIPRVPDFIKGIISLRGIIVPIFDLNRRLNLGEAEFSNSTRIIVCQFGERLAGFLVDKINQVVNVPLAKIEPPPTVLSGLDRDFVEGVGRVENRMLILLDLANVINTELND